LQRALKIGKSPYKLSDFAADAAKTKFFSYFALDAAETKK
jgi:hypothetical protein